MKDKYCVMRRTCWFLKYAPKIGKHGKIKKKQEKRENEQSFAARLREGVKLLIF